MTTLERLIQVIAFHTLVDAPITADARLTEDLGLDSMDRYDIACEILETFDVDLTNDIMWAVATVGELASAIHTANTLKRAHAD